MNLKLWKLNKNKDKNESTPENIRFGSKAGYAVREAYNLMRTNLLFAIQSLPAEGGKVIGITSSVPGEGKSNVSINTAAALAETGAKTLLLECDLRRPSIGKYLNLEKTKGLSDHLVSTEKPVIHSGVLNPNLHVVLAGSSPMNPAVLLQSERMKQTVESFRTVFDYIIIDLPPVLSLPDALTVSRYTDGMVLVSRHRYSRKSDINEAVRQLEYAQAKLLGFVYNDYSMDGISSYRNSYGKYGKYGKYGHYSTKTKS